MLMYKNAEIYYNIIDSIFLHIVHPSLHPLSSGNHPSLWSLFLWVCFFCCFFLFSLHFSLDDFSVLSSKILFPTISSLLVCRKNSSSLIMSFYFFTGSSDMFTCLPQSFHSPHQIFPTLDNLCVYSVVYCILLMSAFLTCIFCVFNQFWHDDGHCFKTNK